jgi:hypothetical protein
MYINPLPLFFYCHSTHARSPLCTTQLNKMSLKHTTLILFLAVLGTTLAQHCTNSITPTPRAKSSWSNGGYGYQLYDIVIQNQTPTNCSTTLCTPVLNFINCDILSHWNWNASCTNCGSDGSHGSTMTYSANAVFWNNLAPGQVSVY